LPSGIRHVHFYRPDGTPISMREALGQPTSAPALVRLYRDDKLIAAAKFRKPDMLFRQRIMTLTSIVGNTRAKSRRSVILSEFAEAIAHMLELGVVGLYRWEYEPLNAEEVRLRRRIAEVEKQLEWHRHKSQMLRQAMWTKQKQLRYVESAPPDERLTGSGCLYTVVDVAEGKVIFADFLPDPYSDYHKVVKETGGYPHPDYGDQHSAVRALKDADPERYVGQWNASNAQLDKMHLNMNKALFLRRERKEDLAQAKRDLAAYLADHGAFDYHGLPPGGERVES